MYNYIKNIILKNIALILWGLGIGDWGLGIGDWGLGPIPNPQSPIPIRLFLLIIINIIKIKSNYLLI